MGKIRCWLILLLVIAALGIVGCEGDQGTDTGDGGTADVTAEAAPVSPTRDPNLPTETPLPTPTPLPPTWTPQPSPTEPEALPTVVLTRDRPTATMVILPSYTPTPVPPTDLPPGPLLVITPAMINNILQAEMASGAGGYYVDPPVVSLQEGLVLISVTVLTTPNDITTARPLVIQATVDLESKVLLRKLRANFSDNNAVYNEPVVEDMLLAAENTINRLIVDLYGGRSERFAVSEVVVAPEGISVQTITRTE
ncbi:MAG: hypothetical protein JXJ20_13200 [Anaerolineae bacterium]|nr:hypothetical protein [Anaerolineae bacterium]